ncbi:MAG: C69 family dipeptidase, partial [Bacteroidales bacterium]
VDGQQYFNERPISTQQSAWVFVSQLRSSMVDPIGGVFWFGCDDANMTVFTPMYCCTDVVPACYQNGIDGANDVTFSFQSAFWVMNWVANMVYPRYDLMIDDVKAIQGDLENTFFQAQDAVEATAQALYQQDPAKAKAYLTNYSNMMAMNTIDTWKKLGEYLVVKYNDGVVKRMPTTNYIGKHTKQIDRRLVRPGIPKGLQEEIARQTGDRYKMPK